MRFIESKRPEDSEAVRKKKSEKFVNMLIFGRGKLGLDVVKATKKECCLKVVSEIQKTLFERRGPEVIECPDCGSVIETDWKLR